MTNATTEQTQADTDTLYIPNVLRVRIAQFVAADAQLLDALNSAGSTPGALDAMSDERDRCARAVAVLVAGLTGAL